MPDVWLTPCPRCLAAQLLSPSGKRPLIQILNTAAHGGSRVRYLGCRRCGFRPRDNKRIIAVELSPPRAGRRGY